MKIKAIHMNELLEKNDDLYENIVVAAKRARQIIDSRAIDFVKPLIPAFDAE